MRRRQRCNHREIRRDGSPPSRFRFTLYTFGRIGFLLSGDEYELIVIRHSDDGENRK